MYAVKNILGKPAPIIVVIVAIIGAYLIWYTKAQKTPAAGHRITSVTSDETIDNEAPASNPISDIWELDSAKTPHHDTSARVNGDKNQTPTGLSVTGVYQTIGKIQYKGNQLILDDQARQLLESSFQNLGENVTQEQIEELQSMLLSALPGSIGEQAAQVIGKYFAYQQALQNEPIENLSVEENIALRERNLGVRLNARLYGTGQAFQRYLNATEQVKMNSAIDEEQRNHLLSQLKQDLNSGVFNIADSRPKELQDISDLTRESPELKSYLTTQALALSAAHKNLDTSKTDWQQRYQQYNEQRRWVVAAALTSEDKRKQLEQLYSEYFTPEERSKIEDYIDSDALSSL